MKRGWIRLWRKIEDNRLLRDPVALQIFIYLLIIVDKKTGEKDIGRFWVSKVLGLKPGTFYDGLRRLSSKYQILNIKTNNKYTTIRLINWAKYQGNGKIPTQSTNNRPTTDQHTTRIENKEYIDKNEKILIGEEARRAIATIKGRIKMKSLD